MKDQASNPYSKERFTLLEGDALEQMAAMPASSVHVVCTSPPYWALRDYGIEGQIGLEPQFDCFGWVTSQPCGVCHICAMVKVFTAVGRVLRGDGTLWLNYGDAYVSEPNGRSAAEVKRLKADDRTFADKPLSPVGRCGLANKNLLQMPARVAMALQHCGWILRSRIIWAKTNPMPTSVEDRPFVAQEDIFLFSKRPRYYYDFVAVMQKVGPGGRLRNLRDVWEMPIEPFAGAHTATFPVAIPKRAIMAGTSEAGCCPICGAGYKRLIEKTYEGSPTYTRAERQKVAGKGHSADKRSEVKRMGEGVQVKTLGWEPSCRHESAPEDQRLPAVAFDPFLGTGTTAEAALSLGRHAVGIELNPKYWEICMKRLLPFRMQGLLF